MEKVQAMYEYPLYRPPSEADSLILQITSGCSYNKCTFCAMYKDKRFSVKSIEEIESHIRLAKSFYPLPRKIFLADGNFLCLSTEKQVRIINMVKDNFPSSRRISAYAGPLDLLGKGMEELKLIKAAGLDLLYLGVESGSDEVLKAVNKGVTAAEMIEACLKAKEAGFILSCMLISGLGGRKLLENHAVESARLISEINPDYLALLTLMIPEDAPLYEEVRNGNFEALTPNEIMLELKLFLENTRLDGCIFRANHASNYISLRGVLDRDKERFLEEIENAAKSNLFKPDWIRGL